jgi:hypothetical protein
MELDDLLTNATTRPSNELDRVVGSNGLKDAERPMWEAFDVTAPTTNSTTGTTQTIQ